MTDIKELVERLASKTVPKSGTYGMVYEPDSDCLEAAEALTTLSSEVERMRGALEKIRSMEKHLSEYDDGILACAAIQEARAALSKDTPNTK